MGKPCSICLSGIAWPLSSGWPSLNLDLIARLFLAKGVLAQGTKSADLMRALQGSMVNWAQSGPTVRLLLISFFPLLIGWFQVDQILHTIKNLVSDGHFCTSFCPAQSKTSISGDLKHCYHVLTYPY